MTRTLDKHAAILEAATEIFLRDGFEAASMEAITQRAGVSKATVYSHFPTKHALFAAIVHGRCACLVPQIEAATETKAPPAEVLTAIGHAFLEILVSDTALSLYRVVVAEAPRQPEVGRAFYEAGPDRLAGSLASYLADQARQGKLALRDPRLAAEQFLGMICGHHHLRVLLGIRDTELTPEERNRQVESSVSRFLAASLPRAGG